MSLFSDMPSDDGLPGAQRRLAMFAVMLGTTMAVLDGTIVNIALPSMAHALQVPPDQAIWIANAYLLVTAAALVTFASLADIVGYRRIYVAGLCAFTLSSLGCALSTSLAALVSMRIIQGLGGAAMFSVGPAIYRTTFPTRLLGSILGVNALVVAASTAVGPAIGGGLLAIATWPWLFAVNLPIGIAAMTLALRALPASPAKPTDEARWHWREFHRRFDIIGAVWCAIAMAAVILCANACAHLGQTAARHEAALFAVVGVVASILFIRRQRRAEHPLLPLDIFSSQRFSLATMTSLFSFGAQGMTFVALPFLFQGAFGYSAFHSALLFTPWPLAIVIAAPYAGRLADRHSAAILSTAGLTVLALGLAALALLPAHASVWTIVWRGFICGLGFGFFQSPNNREIMGSVPKHRTGAASGVLGMARTYGQSLGAAVVAIVLATRTEALIGVDGVSVDSDAAHLALWIAAGTALLGAVFSASRIRHTLTRNTRSATD